MPEIEYSVLRKPYHYRFVEPGFTDPYHAFVIIDNPAVIAAQCARLDKAAYDLHMQSYTSENAAGAARIAASYCYSRALHRTQLICIEMWRTPMPRKETL